MHRIVQASHAEKRDPVVHSGPVIIGWLQGAL